MFSRCLWCGRGGLARRTGSVRFAGGHDERWTCGSCGQTWRVVWKGSGRKTRVVGLDYWTKESWEYVPAGCLLVVDL